MGRRIAFLRSAIGSVPRVLLVLYFTAALAIILAASVIRSSFPIRLFSIALLVIVMWIVVLALFRTGRRGVALAVTTGALLIAFTLTPRIESLLQTLYLAGDESFGMSQGLFEIEGLTGGVDEARRAVGTWMGFEDRAPGKTPGTIIALWWLLIDSMILVPAYGLISLRWVLDEHGPMRSRLRETVVKVAVRWIRVLVVAVLAIDMVENGLSALTIATVSVAEPESLLGTLATGLAWTLSLALVLKWPVGLLALIPGLLILLPKAAELRPSKPLGHGLVMARFQILGLVALAVLGYQFADQLEDVIIDMSTCRLVGVLFAAGLLGLLLAGTARGLIETDRDRTEASLSESQGWAAARVLAIVWLVVLLTWAPWREGERGVPGLLIGIGIVAVVWLLSWAIGRGARGQVVANVTGKVNPSERPGTPSLSVPAIIAGVPMLLVGIWLMQATIKLVLFEDTAVEDGFWALLWKLFFGAALVFVACTAVHYFRFAAAKRWKETLARGFLPALSRIMAGIGLDSVRREWEHAWWNNRKAWWTIALLFGYFMALVVGGVAWTGPVERAPSVGVLLLLFAGLAVLTGLGSGLVLAADWVSDRLSPTGKNLPPELFRLAGLNRIPVITLLIVWLMVNQFIFKAGDHFDVRPIRNHTTEMVPREGVSLDDAFAAWTKEAQLNDCTVPADDDDALRGVPVIMVSSEGGGIRAAYWAASVIDAIFTDATTPIDTDVADEETPAPADCASSLPAWSHVIIASGISGGSVGIAAYLQQSTLAEPTSENWAPDAVTLSQWEKERLAEEHEFMSAPLSWLLGPELVGWHFLRLPMASRIEFHERAIEQAWDFASSDDSGLLRLYRDIDTGDIGPWVIFNAASVADGCIVNMGPLDLSTTNPEDGCLRLPERSSAQSAPLDLSGGVDVTALTCRNVDYSIFTAAMVSARFPVISPSSRFQCGSGPDISSIDGGAVDASGALTPLLIWPDLLDEITRWNQSAVAANAGQPTRTCLVPVHIHIDNGGEAEAQVRDSFDGGQIDAFRTAQNSGRDSRSDRHRLALQELFDSPYEFNSSGSRYVADVDTTFFRVFPSAAPNAQAPLGWFLSAVATGLMDDQLKKSADQILNIRALFDGGLRCVPQS